MAATPVFEFAVPPPYAASFTNGEKALAVHDPMSATPPLSGYYLARWLPVPPGLYVLKSVADDAAQWFVGVAMVLSTQKNQGVFETEIFFPEGTTRMDLMLQNIDTTAAQCFVAFSLYQNGRLMYSSDANGWMFDSAPIADADLGPMPDSRNDLPIFSVLPNWADGMLERLEWLTDVLVSETGAEMRRSIRPEPRRSVEASFLRSNEQRSMLDTFLTGVGQGVFLMPLWFEQYRPPEGLGMGASTITFPDGSLSTRAFRTNDLIIVMGKGPNDFDVVKASNVDTDAGVINLTASLSRAWPYGTRVIPLRKARITEAPELSNPTANVGQTRMRFFLEEPEQQVEPSWEEGRRFPFRPNRSTDISMAYGRMTFVLDNQTATPVNVDLGERAMIAQRQEMLFFGRTVVAQFRAWLGECRGRARRFYMPTFERDIVPQQDLVGAEIYAEPMGFADYMQNPQEARRYIGIKLRDGTTSYHRVTSISATRTPQGRAITDIFAITPPLADVVPVENIMRIEFMVPTRFDQDAFELTHYVDESAAVATNVVTRSTDSAGMPSLIA